MNWDRDKERKAAKSMGVAMSIFAIIFALVWCLMAASMGAWFMLLFGIPFVGILVYRLVVMLKLTKEDPKHGAQPRQEADPWDTTQNADRLMKNFRSLRSAYQEEFQDEAEDPDTRAGHRNSPKFCPHCSFWLQDGFDFCPKCGRRIS